MGKRKQKHEEHVNLERWLVSYADFITLLFATFVVLYALSQVDLAKFKELKTSFKKAFATPSILQGDTSIFNQTGSHILQGFDGDMIIPPFMEYKEAIYEEKSFEKAKETLDKTQEGKIDNTIETKIDQRGLTISFIDSLFFESGSSQLKKSSVSDLKKIGKLLSENFFSNMIRIEGHTDSDPISTKIFPSNWELSSARASSVVRYLIKNFNLEKSHFAAVGYADSRTKEKTTKKKKRRVDIVILRNKLSSSEPKLKDFNKERKENIQKIIETEKQKEKKCKKHSSISEAAKKLIIETGHKIENVIIYKDHYEKENDELKKELKKMESKYKGH